MHALSKEQISSWKKKKGSYNENYFPGAINSHCPHCGSLVTFSFTHWLKGLHGVTVARTQCPVCDEDTRFLMLDYDPTTQDFDEETTLWIYPPLKIRESIPDIEKLLEMSPQLVTAYRSTVNVFNNGEWNATAVLTRRFLDVLLEMSLGKIEPGISLEENLEELVNARDLARPVIELTDTISESSLNKYFSLEEEPDKASAELMVELMTLIIEYLFILPRRAERLHEKARALLQARESGAGTDVVEISAVSA